MVKARFECAWPISVECDGLTRSKSNASAKVNAYAANIIRPDLVLIIACYAYPVVLLLAMGQEKETGRLGKMFRDMQPEDEDL